VEPCFEGATITKEIKFSLEDDFKNKMFSLMEEMKNILEGGAPTVDNSEMLENGEQVVTPTEEPVEEAALEENKPAAEEPELEEEAVEDSAAAEEPELIDEVPPVEEEPVAATYNLDDIVEYQELVVQFEALQTQYAALETTCKDLQEENARLTTFKATIDKQEKEKMINSFYMLSDEDKKDVIENIDTYSLDEIEAKLSIICVRNKVSFSLEEEDNSVITDPTIYNA
jgi:hypothetical protein